MSEFQSVIQLSAFNGSNGFRLDGGGISVSSAGDINGDGFADLIIGTLFANGRAGVSYVVFGLGGPFNSSLNVAM